jgi:NAD+ diphosphatase
MATVPSHNYFAAGSIDRAGDRRRDPDWLEGRLSAPEARLLGIRSGQVPVDADNHLVLLPLGGRALDDNEELVFLGLGHDGTAVFALELTGVATTPPVASDGDEMRFIDLRGAAMFLDPEEANQAAYASAMLTWHRRHRFCGLCGGRTSAEWAGHLRRCPTCGAEHFPRTDPVIIVLVTTGGSCLLGRQPGWPPTMWSALAGFVEPGESLEDAVGREVREEAGISVAEVTYHSSQPWPFPLSLMVGFLASAGPGPSELRVDHSELDDAQWFDGDELADAVQRGAIMLPPPFSIARQLVESWLSSPGRALR